MRLSVSSSEIARARSSDSDRSLTPYLFEVLLMPFGINGDIPAIAPMAAGRDMQIAAVNTLEIWVIIKVAVVHVSGGVMTMIRDPTRPMLVALDHARASKVLGFSRPKYRQTLL
jgi:hypothetical protein